MMKSPCAVWWLKVFCFGFVGLVTALAQDEQARSEIALRELPLLFVDDAGVLNREGVARTVHPADTRSEPVLQGDRPWEAARVYIYGSVYPDSAGNGYRLWYLGRPEPEVSLNDDRLGHSPELRASGFNLVLYATSPDGLQWTKPNLGLFNFDHSKDNNIVFDLHSPSVLFDPLETDPAKRYKMLGALQNQYHAAYSADGLHWKSYPRSPILEYSDTITLARDPFTAEYLAYHKRPATVRGFPRRVVWLSRSRDFQTWSTPQMVFAPDEEDDSWAERPGEHTEVYNMSVFPHAAGFVGLPTIFRVLRTRSKDQIQPGQSPIDGPIDVQLATSRDGTHWRRSWPRVAMIPRGNPGTFDGGAILGVSSTAVDAGDETWVYYTALTTTHGAPMPPKRISIGRAEWRRHGFVSLDADPTGGRVETQPLRFFAPDLVVNADATRGEVRVALLEASGQPIAGFSSEECLPLQRDETQWRVTWRGKSQVPMDRALRVVVTLKSARLFSLASGGADAPEAKDGARK